MFLGEKTKVQQSLKRDLPSNSGSTSLSVYQSCCETELCLRTLFKNQSDILRKTMFQGYVEGLGMPCTNYGMK